MNPSFCHHLFEFGLKIDAGHLSVISGIPKTGKPETCWPVEGIGKGGIGVDKQKPSRYSLSFGAVTLFGSEHAEAWL
jgi:hypothetical protein